MGLCGLGGSCAASEEYTSLHHERDIRSVAMDRLVQLRGDMGMRGAAWFTWAILAVLLLGTGLGLYQLAADSLWLDEIMGAQFVQEPSLRAALGNLMGFADRPVHIAIIYYIRALGSNEFWLRLPSVIFGVLSLAVTYKVGQVLFNKGVGLVAATLLALSPFHLSYCQEARSYSLFMLLSILSLFCLLRAWRAHRWHWWAGFTVVSILNTYTHYFSFFVLAAEFTVSGLLWLAEVIACQSGPGRRRTTLGSRHRRLLIGLAVSLLLIALAFLPSLPHLRAYVDKQGGGGSVASGLELTPEFLLSVLGKLGGGSVARSPDTTWLFVSLFVLGLVASGLEHQKRAILWSLVWMLLPFVILFLIPSKHFFHLRYLIFILPLYLIVVARGLAALGESLAALLGRWKRAGRLLAGAPWSAGAAWVLVFAGFGALTVGPLDRYYAAEKENWRAATEYLRARIQPGDLIICEGIQHLSAGDGGRAYRAMEYYFPEAFQSNVVILQDHTAETVQAMPDEERGVWGLVFGGAAKWEPDADVASVAKFTRVAVIHIQGGHDTALERSILLMTSLLEFLQGEARYNVHLELGRLYSLRGNDERALGQYDLAVGEAPSNALAARALQEKAGVFRANRDWPGAISSYLTAVERNPGNAWIYVQLGEVYGLAGETDEAVAACERAASMDSGNPNPGLSEAVANCLAGLADQENEP